MNAALELPPLPALVVGTVSHRRQVPQEHAFEHDHYQWLVDLDDLPRHRRPGRAPRFEARDHLDRGRLGGGIRGDLVRWLAGRDVEVRAADRILMLAHARSMGHVFDPLTVFWVLDAEQRLKALVLEVHNTYGERHVYLVDTDANGRGEVEKAFYVSPFNDTAGRYRVGVRLGPELVRVSVALDRDAVRVLTAVTTGTPIAATPANRRRVALRHLFITYRVSLLIRVHGIRLWAARLPIQHRPRHSEEAVR